MEQLRIIANIYGFSECYCLRPDLFEFYERRRQIDGALHRDGQSLVSDPRTSFPWANVLLALVAPYRPFLPEMHISGYYVGSNRAYHATKSLRGELTAAGIRTERAEVPIRELLLRSGIGRAMKNGLTAIDGYGTRFAVQVLAADVPQVHYDDISPRETPCGNCNRCRAACPSGAIQACGMNFHRCIRAYLCGDEMPGWVMEKMDCLLGCEACQYACPVNDGIQNDGELPPAFDLERILSGDIKPLLALIGSNQKSGGRLLMHAAVLAAKQSRTDLLPLIVNLLQDARAQVRNTAKWSICRLRKEENCDTLNHIDLSLPR